LEQSTWASHARIERLANTELKMVVPDPAMIVIVKQ
jgi:cell division protein FtsL